MKFGIVRFPGSNCDTDAFHVTANLLREEAAYLWHEDESLQGVDCVILPGGFAHGDYLRAGAMAKISPIMNSIRSFAANGGLVLGICNGFQVLTESDLLPGALMRNQDGRFVCDWVHLRVENNKTPFTSLYEKGEVLRMPVAHGEGRFFLDDIGLRNLEDEERVVFRYCDADGKITPQSNVNGSLASIAGVCSRNGTVLGLMPHPERCAEVLLGGQDGLRLFEAIRRGARV